MVEGFEAVEHERHERRLPAPRQVLLADADLPRGARLRDARVERTREDGHRVSCAKVGADLSKTDMKNARKRQAVGAHAPREQLDGTSLDDGEAGKRARVERDRIVDAEQGLPHRPFA